MNFTKYVMALRPAFTKTWEYSEIAPEAAAKIQRLAFHYGDTQNPWFALEAVKICIELDLYPPEWCWQVIAPGLIKHLQFPEGDLAQQVGLTKRGSGSTPPLDDYKSRYKLSSAMPDMWKLAQVMGVNKSASARAVILKHELSYTAKSFARIYSDKWVEFFLTMGFSNKPLSEKERTRFITSFPENARTDLNRALRKLRP